MHALMYRKRDFCAWSGCVARGCCAWGWCARNGAFMDGLGVQEMELLCMR